MPLIADYKPNHYELVSFLTETDFQSEITTEEYAAKVMKNATFIALKDSSSTLKGLSVFYANREEKDFAYLTYIAIDKRYRKMGEGKSLLSQTIKTAKEKGFKILRLEVNKNNKIAKHLYESNGFITVEQTGETYYMERIL